MKDILLGLVYGGAFLVLFIPLMVTDSMFFPFITGKNFAFRIIVEIIFASWVLLALLDAQYRPRFSWMLVSLGTLLVVMFFANIFGEYPLKSFWSNFERMDGYVTLVHFALYFVVLGSILRTEKMWSYFMHTSLVVAAFVGLAGLSKSTGSRIDSSLGNASYMAIYMLFNIALIALMALRSKQMFTRFLYAVVMIVFVYILLRTGTRGTFIGLVGGTTLATLYVIFFGGTSKYLRKAAIGSFIFIVVVAGVFVSIRDSDLVQSNPATARIANIDLQKDLIVRSTIWAMAYEGFKERPLLGWGQGNFNYVFNAKFDPSLHSQESWFDRVHNIFFDWLIAGGILGLAAYLSIFVGCLYYLFWKPMLKKSGEESFSVAERAILIGILAGYFAHNIVVFDNLVSYTFFAIILAFIHSRTSTPIESLMNIQIDQKVLVSVIAPVIIVATGAVVYFTNVPSMHAAWDIIDAFVASEIDDRFNELDSAFDRGSFADQEITEQIAQMAISIASNKNIQPEVKEKHLKEAERAIIQLIEDKPGDARLHVFLSSFYRSIRNIERAQDQINIAHELSPNKQTIILEQGTISLILGDRERAGQYFKQAYDLAPEFKIAQLLYASSLLYSGEGDRVRDIVSEKNFIAFALDDYALQAAEANGAIELLIEMLEIRIIEQPSSSQAYASLAFVYYREGDIEKAIEVLEKGVAEIPTFTAGTCYINNLKAGETDPSKGC